VSGARRTLEQIAENTAERISIILNDADDDGMNPSTEDVIRAACAEYAAGEVEALREALDAVEAEAQKIYDTPRLTEGPVGYAGGMRYATRRIRAALAKHGGGK